MAFTLTTGISFVHHDTSKTPSWTNTTKYTLRLFMEAVRSYESSCRVEGKKKSM